MCSGVKKSIRVQGIMFPGYAEMVRVQETEFPGVAETNAFAKKPKAGVADTQLQWNHSAIRSCGRKCADGPGSGSSQETPATEVDIS